MKHVSEKWFRSVLAVALGLLSINAAKAQIWVVNGTGTTIGEYNTDGTTINASLVSGLTQPDGLTISGTNLYVASYSPRLIGEYNATTGATINASLVSLPTQTNPQGLAIFSNSLYSANNTSTLGAIGEYNATTGTAINSALVSGGDPAFLALSSTGADLYYTGAISDNVVEVDASTGTVVQNIAVGLTGPGNTPGAIAISGNNLYVSRIISSSPSIGVYNATTGAVINANLVADNGDIAIAGNDLYVSNFSAGTISEYDATTGSLINASLVTGLSGPEAIFVEAQAVPEPSTWAMLIGGLGLLAFCHPRMRRVSVTSAKLS